MIRRSNGVNIRIDQVLKSIIKINIKLLKLNQDEKENHKRKILSLTKENP